ncbi:MAG: DUF4384 domain-containing protein [Prevotella sp.]|nr:DUF4384 domain-containing protein [Prevotella sp.]
MKIRQYFLLFFMLNSLAISSQKVKTVESEYTYCAPPILSPLEAKNEAISRAKTEAIANTFGFIVTSNNFIGMDNIDGQSHTSFSTLSESEVKGEWLRDLETPKVVNMAPMEDMTLCITVHVKGEAREIVSSSVNYKVKILRNGEEDVFEADEFKEGDRFYMSFSSPVDGYLAVYMLDDNGSAWRLLPYTNSSDPSFRIEHGRDYVLFSERHGGDGIEVTCDKNLEFNHIYTLFSPNKFTRPIDNGVSPKDNRLILPPNLSLKQFQKWFVGIRKYDKELTINRKTIKITKREQ